MYTYIYIYIYIFIYFFISNRKYRPWGCSAKLTHENSLQQLTVYSSSRRAAPNEHRLSQKTQTRNMLARCDAVAYPGSAQIQFEQIQFDVPLLM